MTTLESVQYVPHHRCRRRSSNVTRQTYNMNSAFVDRFRHLSIVKSLNANTLILSATFHIYAAPALPPPPPPLPRMYGDFECWGFPTKFFFLRPDADSFDLFPFLSFRLYNSFSLFPIYRCRVAFGHWFNPTICARLYAVRCTCIGVRSFASHNQSTLRVGGDGGGGNCQLNLIIIF